jgi:hypothetical protein
MAAMINIGGSDMPNPTEYEVTLQDLDSENTTRSESGVLTRTRIRAGVYAIKLTWRVSKTELKTITDAIAAASFTLVFFDPTTAAYPSITAYVGNRSAKMLAYETGSESTSWWELSCDFIQY